MMILQKNALTQHLKCYTLLRALIKILGEHMKDSGIRFALSRRLLIILSFLYLILQTGLFLQGWFTPLVANGLLIGILSTLIIYYLRFSKSDSQNRWNLNRRDVWYTLLAIIIIVSILLIGGMLGGFPSHSDFYVFRQALHLNLIHAPWPLILPNGREMSYYLAAMLPPAMFARYLPEGLWQQIPLLLNTLFPLILTLLLIWHRRKKSSLLFLLIFLAFSEPLRIVFHPKTKLYIGPFLDLASEMSGLDAHILTSWYASLTLLTPVLQCVGMYNSFPSTLLTVALLPHLRQSRGLIPLCIALLVPISPLGAFACMPIALWAFIPRNHKFIRFRSFLSLLTSVLLPVLLVAASAVYFLRVDSDLNVIAPSWQVKGSSFWLFYLRYLAGALILILPLWPHRKRDSLYWITSLSAMLLPLLYIGSLESTPGIWGFNELVLKGSIVYTLILGSMWYDDWKRLGKIRYFMILWMSIVALHYLERQTSSFDIHHPVEDMWNGHLCHDRLFLKQSIPDVKDPLLPGVLLRTSGESERCFPGSLLPKADGHCPYGTPPAPDAFP